MQDIRNAISQALNQSINKIVISNIADKSYPYKKVEVHPVWLKGCLQFQISAYTEKQVFQTNVIQAELLDLLLEHFPEHLCQMNVFGEKNEYSFKMTKKLKLLSNKKKTDDTKAVSSICNASENIDRKENANIRSHNRKKNYILQEGMVIPPLVDMGVFTKDGKVVNAMYDKFKQINRFVELVDDILKDYSQDEINIIDFGCGKSYLTFILYYYLVELKGKKANIIGLDLKTEVIEKCNQTARKYGYESLHFERGDIQGYHTNMQVDMVVTLHACDTATDYALSNAVNWNARYILSVPCCQHELNQQMGSRELETLMRYGIIKERIAALATDAIRADMLTYRGYKTQVLEFVDLAHSPKNLLIRAVKSGISKEKREQALRDVKNSCERLQITPTICRLLSQEKDV